MLDLLVIGAGLAGLAAAYRAAEAGLRVRVIAKGMGATHWSAGTIDVLGYRPEDPAQPVQHPLADLPALIEAHPRHPYALVGASRTAELLKTFQRWTGEIGLPYSGAPRADENLWLPSPVGAPRPAFLVPLAQQAGALHHRAPLLIVGFDRLRDFYPELIAENLNKQGYPARAASLPLDLITQRRDSNTVQLALSLEQAGPRSRLGAALQGLVQPGERVGLPALLGLEKHLAVLADLQARVGAPIFEIPTLPPSVPGIRLHTALCQRLVQMGVQIEVGMAAIGFHATEGRIEWVATETSARPLQHRSTKVLLATGGILGGGLDSDHTGRLWEVIFDLPLSTPAARSQWFRPQFLDPAGHPIFRAGVQVNPRFQPIHPDGEPVYQNLWAAGGLLAHADPIQERSLEGIAIVTAIAAVDEIVRGGE